MSVHVRINTVPSYQLESLYKEHKIERYLIGQEEGHTHTIIWSDKLGTNYNNLRRWIKKKFNIEGNGQYSISKVREVVKACAYVIKDGCYIQFGIPIIDMAEYLAYSFPKVQGSGYLKRLVIVEHNYDASTDFREFISQVIELRIELKLGINPRALMSYFRMQRAKVCKQYREYVIDQIYLELFS